MAIETKAYCNTDKLGKDEVLAFFSKRVQLGDEADDYSRYESDNIRLAVGTDGNLWISDYSRDSAGIYFYPDQLEHLQTALEAALKQRDLAKVKPQQS